MTIMGPYIMPVTICLLNLLHVLKSNGDNLPAVLDDHVRHNESLQRIFFALPRALHLHALIHVRVDI